MLLKSWKRSAMILSIVSMVLFICLKVAGTMFGVQWAGDGSQTALNLFLCSVSFFVAFGVWIDARRDHWTFEMSKVMTAMILQRSGGASSMAAMRARVVAEAVCRVSEVSAEQIIEMLQDPEFRKEIEEAKDVTEVRGA